MIFGQTVEDDGGDGEVLVPDVVDVGVQGEQAMLAVDGSQDPLALRHLQLADRGTRLNRLERQLLIARDDDGAGNGGQVAGIAALLVVLDQFVNLSPDDLALVGLLARGDALLEQVPVHLGGHFLLGAAHGRMPGFAVVQHLEANQLVDVAGSQ